MRFTQYLRPDGRPRVVFCERSKEIEDMAEKLVAKGCEFECEVLTTDEVFLYCMKNDKSICDEMCDNGPEVPETVDRLVENAYDMLIRD